MAFQNFNGERLYEIWDLTQPYGGVAQLALYDPEGILSTNGGSPSTQTLTDRAKNAVVGDLSITGQALWTSLVKIIQSAGADLSTHYTSDGVLIKVVKGKDQTETTTDATGADN